MWSFLPVLEAAVVSIAGIISITTIIIFGPLAGALIDVCSGIVTAITTAASSRKEPTQKRASLVRRALFNIGMFVVSTILSGYAYILCGGQIGKINILMNIFPLIVLVSVREFLNIFILIGVLSIQTAQSFYGIWKNNFGPVIPIGVIGGVFGGGLLAFSYVNFGFAGLAIFFLPVLATSYSLRLYTSNMRVYVNDLEKVNKDLDDANLGLLQTMAAVIDAYDVYTSGHSSQVAIYASEVAKKMGLHSKEIDILFKAALVHDIGKVGIPDTIIGKQGSLTNEEYIIVKRHPVIGADIVGQMKGLQGLVSLVRHHHERWDGKGYPEGLAGEQIPVSVRILTLADTLDTLCSDRPYRPTRSFDEVVAEIKRCSGTQFDPNVVTAFLSLVEERGRDYFMNSAASVDNTFGLMVKDKVRYLKKSMLDPNS